MSRERALAALLASERKARGINQAEFARQLGVTAPVLCRLLKAVHTPDLKTLDRVAAGLGQSTWSLLAEISE